MPPLREKSPPRFWPLQKCWQRSRTHIEWKCCFWWNVAPPCRDISERTATLWCCRSPLWLRLQEACPEKKNRTNTTWPTSLKRLFFFLVHILNLDVFLDETNHSTLKSEKLQPYHLRIKESKRLVLHDSVYQVTWLFETGLRVGLVLPSLTYLPCQRHFSSAIFHLCVYGDGRLLIQLWNRNKSLFSIHSFKFCDWKKPKWMTDLQEQSQLETSRSTVGSGTKWIDTWFENGRLCVLADSLLWSGLFRVKYINKGFVHMAWTNQCLSERFAIPKTLKKHIKNHQNQKGWTKRNVKRRATLSFLYFLSALVTVMRRRNKSSWIDYFSTTTWGGSHFE